LTNAIFKGRRAAQLENDFLCVTALEEGGHIAMDGPLAWTQHVTLIPPFPDPATTQFRASMTRSVVSQADPGFNAYLTPGKEFPWPLAPPRDGGESDLRQMHKTSPASGYTTHLADAQRDHAYFIAFTPRFRQAFGYVGEARISPGWVSGNKTAAARLLRGPARP
jgi:hypothetical protein